MSAVWFKCFPSDFLNGIADLDEFERGIYISIILIMYDQGGSVVYETCPKNGNAKSLARRCGTSTRRFNSTVKTLINDGKLIHREGRLFNKKVFKTILPGFISDLSLKYLVLIYPKWRNFNDLAWAKKLEARIQKKINNKKDLKLVASDGDLISDLEMAVSEVYGPDVWMSWFSRCEIEGKTIYPNLEFAKTQIEQNFMDVVLDQGYTLESPRKKDIAK